MLLGCQHRIRHTHPSGKSRMARGEEERGGGESFMLTVAGVTGQGASWGGEHLDVEVAVGMGERCGCWYG